MSAPNDELIPTRATLIHRLKNWQDQASWQNFFDTYWKLIYGVALKGGLTKSEAQDVVQEIMMAVAKHMPTFQYDPSIGSFKGWLLNMTRWRIVDHIRKRQRMPVEVVPDDLNESGDEDPDGNETQALHRLADPFSENIDALWNAEWEKNLLDTAVTNVKRRVEPQKYQVFDFNVNKGWTPEKVAKAFGLSVEQVYLTKHRVTDLIKDEVKRLENEMS